MANSWQNPRLVSPIRTDVPELQEKLIVLLKQDPTSISDIPVGAKRLYEVSSGKWEWQEYNGSSWTTVPFLQHNVDQLDGYHAAITPAANTVAVRNADKKLEGDITGNAATASSATTLSQTLPVNKGGTGATTSAAARSNLGVPPTSHASTSTTYGVGDDTRYGHLKLSNATDSISGVSGGVAATPAAVKDAKDAADVAMIKASTLATTSTPGVVKPGTGLQIGEEGALNVVAEQTGCLPLTGGTMNGHIAFSNKDSTNIGGGLALLNDERGYRVILDTYEVGDCGAVLELFKSTSTISPSCFGLTVRNGSNNEKKSFYGTLSGLLRWGDKNIVRSVNNVNADDSGNVRVIPAGSVIAFAANTTPSGGFIICNGAAVSRTTYAELFAAIGTTYGTGDGSTTFNLPNLTDGRYIRGGAELGTYYECGLPLVWGRVYGSNVTSDLMEVAGVEGGFWTVNGSNMDVNLNGAIKVSAPTIIGFDASLCSDIYGSSDEVLPRSLVMHYYIKY